MNLSLWKCDADGCPSTAVGEAGAIGLRAIGWHFNPGPAFSPLLCPLHRPDTVDCRDKPGHDCPQCAAETEARRLQPRLMTDDEQDYYLREILPTLQRQDLERAVRAADGRPPRDQSHFPPELCEHGVWQYGGCKNADCHNCADNIFIYHPSTATFQCAACQTCAPYQPCRISDNCPMLWCACHKEEATP